MKTLGHPGIGAARRLLGWEPKVPRRDGLRRAIVPMRDTLGKAGPPVT